MNNEYRDKHLIDLTDPQEPDYMSQCCGVEMNDWPDSDLCPRCLEHTGVENDDTTKEAF